MSALYRLSAVVGISLVFVSSAFAQSPCSGAAIFGSSVCVGDDVSAEEQDLYNAVNSFRAANGKSLLRLSGPLSRLGNRRMLDITQNMRSLTHSWSNCAYEIANQKTWTCMMDAPVRLNSGYKGRGYETLYATGSKKVDPGAALAAWKKSPLHSSIILGTGTFASMAWDEFGVAISGGYATLWFGDPTPATDTSAAGGNSLRDIQQAFDGIGNGTRSGAAWTTTSRTGTLSIEISDANADFYSTSVRIFLTPVRGAVDAKTKDDVARLLKLKNPEWPDLDRWLGGSIAASLQQDGGRRVKLTSRCAVEVSRDGRGRVLVSIYPKSQARPKDDF